MPVFVDYPSDVAPPPFNFKSFDSATFRLIPKKKEVLQQLTNELVNNHIDNSKNHFKVHESEPRVLLTVSDFPNASSSNTSLGTLSYQEFVLSFAVFNTREQYDKAHLCAYIWIDGPLDGTQEYYSWNPSATGRELFGLPKTRGEIVLHTDDFTGVCKHLPPPLVGEIKPVPAIRISKSGTDLSMLRRRSLGGPDVLSSDDSLAQFRRFRDRMAEVLQNDVRDRIGEFGADPLWREKQLLRFFWGPSEGWPRWTQDGIDDLGPSDLAMLNSSINTDSSKSSSSHISNSTWSGIKLPLMGLRQLHDAQNHANAIHQQVIAADFEFSTPHETMIAHDYKVEILDSDIRDRLSLEAEYQIDGGTDMMFVGQSDASFATPPVEVYPS